MPILNITGRSLSAAQKEQKLLQTNFFPNQIAAGSFAPHSTIVEVDFFRTRDVHNALVTGDLMSVRKDIQVLCHEMTHWFDFFGTIWGRSYIGDITRAFRAFKRGSETEFPHIIKLFDVDRSVLSPAYYRFTGSPSILHTTANPWTIDYVCGAEIDPHGETREDRPIFMAKFGESLSRDTFARQPISIGALLEVRAIASEIGAAISAIKSHNELDHQAVEMHLARKEFSDLAYDHDLIEYNAAAHILAAQAGTTDIYLSFRLAAALAYIALNLKKTDFPKIRVPDAFGPFGRRNAAFKKRFDRGYAFVAMAFNGGKYDGDEEEYIKRCVASTNLGTPTAILEAAATALEEPPWFSDGNAATAHFFRESLMSKRIAETHSELPFYCLTLQSLMTDLRIVCPPFLDAEGTFIELNEGRIAEYQPEMLHDAAHALRGYTRNLLTGCRGV